MKHYLIGAEVEVAHHEPLGKVGQETPNQAAFDRYTILHTLSGVAMRLVGVSFWWAAAIAVTWELVEPMLKEKYPSMFPQAAKDSMKNKVVDATSMMAGWYGTGLVMEARERKSYESGIQDN